MNHDVSEICRRIDSGDVAAITFYIRQGLTDMNRLEPGDFEPRPSVPAPSLVCVVAPQDGSFTGLVTSTLLSSPLLRPALRSFPAFCAALVGLLFLAACSKAAPEINSHHAAAGAQLQLGSSNVLGQAVFDGNIAKIQTIMLQEKAIADKGDEFGLAPLHWAVLLDLPDVVELLLTNHANPNSKAFDRTTALATTRIALASITEKVTNSAAGYHQRQNFIRRCLPEWSPLHIAADCGDLTVVKALLRAGADPNSKGSWGETPLHMVAGNISAYLALTGTEGQGVLIAKELLANGADVSASTVKEVEHYGSQKLTQMFSRGMMQELGILSPTRSFMSHGLTILVEDSSVPQLTFWVSPSPGWMFQGSPPFLDPSPGRALYLPAGSPPLLFCVDPIPLFAFRGPASSPRGSTIASSPPQKGERDELARLLLAYKPELNNSKIPILPYAIWATSEGALSDEVVGEFIRARTSLTSIDLGGDTAVHLAIDRQKWDWLRLMLASGAPLNLNAVNFYGERPLDIVIRRTNNSFDRGEAEVVKLMLAKGANPELSRKGHKPPADYAHVRALLTREQPGPR